MMIPQEHDPQSSWRNHQRIHFIKGFYKSRKLIEELLREFEENHGHVTHDTIDRLLETQLRALKDMSHSLYRMKDDEKIDRRNQRVFDKILGALWHELDKCRDNIRLLEAYSDSVDYDSDQMMKRVSRIDSQVINAARRDLPNQFRRAKRLMDQLVPLFENILPVYKENETVLRSIYFARDELDPLCHPNTVDYFFPLLYGSTEEGYARLIRSLFETKHDWQACLVMDELLNRVEFNPQIKPLVESLENEFQARLKPSPGAVYP